MSLRDLPKSLIDAVCEVVVDSTEKHQKLVAQLRAEGLQRFGVKRESQLTESDQKALYAWIQTRLHEASCGCEHDVAKEDHMPGDEVLYNKDGEIKKQMDEDDTADKDYDGDGEVESGSDEYLGSRDKAIKAAMKNEEDSEDDVELSENVAIGASELATNGAVGVANAALAKPKHADVIRDTDPTTGVTEYRLLLQYATNEGTRIYPPTNLPGARSVADLRSLVDGLPDFNEAVDSALVHASTMNESYEQISVLSRQDVSQVIQTMRTTLGVRNVDVDDYKSGNDRVVEFSTKINDLYVTLIIEPSKKMKGKYVGVIHQEFGTSPIDTITTTPFDLKDISKSLTSSGAGSIKSALSKVDSDPDNNILQESVKKLNESVTVVVSGDIHNMSGKIIAKDGTKIQVSSKQELASKLKIKLNDLFADSDHEKKFDTILAKKETAYVYVDPYQHDMNDTISLGVATSEKEATKQYNDSAGDI